MRAPSWGFVYLTAVTVGCIGLLVYLSGEFWFSRHDPTARLQEEADYVYALAAKGTGPQRWERFNETLRLSTALGDAERVAEILGLLDAAGVPPEFDPATERVPDAVWVGGFTVDSRTRGNAMALIIARRSAGRRLSLQWEGPPQARATVRRSNGEAQSVAFSSERPALVEVPLDGGAAFELIRVSSTSSIQLARVELLK